MRCGKIIAATLSGVMLAGCANREITFSSTPLGASVEVNGRHGVTPCTLQIPEGATTATFRLASGEEQTLPLPPLDGELENATEMGGKVLGGTLMVAGGAVAGLGFLSFILGASQDQNDEHDYFGTEEEDDWDWDAMGYGLAAMAGGGVVFLLGKWIYPEDENPYLHASFMNEGP